MSESDSSEAATPAKKSRRSFTIEKKLEAIAYAKSTSNRADATKYKVQPKNIRDWKSNEKELKKLR
jgi:hypothetical protein